MRWCSRSGELITSTFWLDAETPIGNMLRVFQRQAAADSLAVVDGTRVEGSTVDAGADPIEVSARALLASFAEVDLLRRENRRLDEENRLRSAALAEMTDRLRVPLRSMRGSIRALMADTPSAATSARSKSC